MVVLDNHISKPGWCCSNTDGNGFFGDQYFDPEMWITGLTKMATLLNGATNVIGMSLRNELRGAKQNVMDWYKYTTRGAEAVHAANPNVLIILSGLSFDTDLSFLRAKQVNLTFSKKLVFELHWYSFSDGSAWLDGNQNQVCGRIVNSVMARAGFLLNQGLPLFLSEFGVDQSGVNIADNRYISCALGVIAELDMDWAIWILQGSYYLRQGILGLDEVYGVLGWDWCKIRNTTCITSISSIQIPYQGFHDVPPYSIIFHPATGLCVLTKSLQALALGLCNKSEAWDYTSSKTIILEGSSLCLIAGGASNNAAMLGDACNGPGSQWDVISDSKMHLASMLPSGGGLVCLDGGGYGNIVTNPCKCLSSNKNCESEIQWFKFVTSTRKISHENSSLKRFLSSKDSEVA